jgi:ABC-type transport system substrate-binding protein
MKLSALLLLAASSLFLLGVAPAATRPRYGGKLRVQTRAASTSLDPVDLNQSPSIAAQSLSSVIFETFVAFDDQGRLQPALAVSWQAEPGNQRWQLELRRGVTFHDGSALTAELAAASLRIANPAWKVSPAGEAIVIQRDSPSPDLLAELALARNAIAKRGGPRVLGTGPFSVAGWTPGKTLTLAAYNDYWGGRPFADSIEVELGQGSREQAIALDLGKADMIEIAPEQGHPIGSEGGRQQNSFSRELMALVFAREPSSAEEGRLRAALSLSLDRPSLANVLLHGAGEPSGGLLPGWMTGYSFLFPVAPEPDKARLILGELRRTSPWTLAYDANDPQERLLAERIALNVRDAGLAVQLTTSPGGDMRLLRAPLASLDAAVALSSMTSSLGLPPPRFNSHSSEDLYQAESLLLQSQRVIPLLHLRTSCGLSATVKDWRARPDGLWPLAEIWLSPEKP